MKQIEPVMPEELDVVLDGAEFLSKAGTEEERIQDKMIRDASADGGMFLHLRVSAVKFENCRFWESSFERGGFTDVIFQSCDFSGCDWSGGYFERVHFIACKGVGAKFSSVTMKNVTVKECNMDYVNFDAARLEKIVIEDTRLNSSNLTQCKCRQVTWKRAELVNASFFKTSLRGMDFTDSIINGLVLSEDNSELHGAIVDVFQAAELAKRMGLIIK
ncbi:pentapeptide repeat-containing protein [Lacrimispora sp. NSJ-141]|uniref:Pentapeptide repeat-containing protein n=1 Tax=Lientehia hominis TaxID=2897778 RepID=A0AAP2RJJ1_9FIRM|nr:pentapeptide repeat-containing protein [Lientehia hominis]MCD2492604.1 pentapeptide repeat-containing protein [Lientehia hominis]